MVSKKEVKEAKKQAKKYESQVNKADINAVWDTIDEMQKNIDFINARLARVLDRMGLE
jgi:tetrahydromethanopterin S-methyltransferase subunit G